MYKCEKCGGIVFNVDDIQHGNEDVCECEPNIFQRFMKIHNGLNSLEARRENKEEFEKKLIEIQVLNTELCSDVLESQKSYEELVEELYSATINNGEPVKDQDLILRTLMTIIKIHRRKVNN